MRRFKKTISLFIILLFSVSTLSLSGCKWHPSEEEINNLEETRAAALAAEKELSEKKAERQELEEKVAAKKAELEKIQADRDAVKNYVEESEEE
ncbi:MAG: hypothetical protein GF313_14780 [Caldithrix sp.]|nr:hypothetical protein [Caldithrix sp.]